MRGVASFGEDEDNKERVNQSMTRRSRRQDLIIIYIYSYYRLHYTYTDTYRVILINLHTETYNCAYPNKQKKNNMHRCTCDKRLHNDRVRWPHVQRYEVMAEQVVEFVFN